MQPTTFNMLMSINLTKILVSLNVRAMPKDKIQRFYDQLVANSREYRLVHIIGKSVMIPLDEKDLSVQPFPVFPQIGLAAVTKIADIKDLIVGPHGIPDRTICLYQDSLFCSCQLLWHV